MQIAHAVLTTFQPRPTNVELGKFYQKKQSIYDSLMFGLFPGDDVYSDNAQMVTKCGSNKELHYRHSEEHK